MPRGHLAFKSKWSSKIAEIRKSTGHSLCVWKGRQGAWWVAVGLDMMLAELRVAMSASLQAALDAADEFTRGQAMHFLEKLRTSLVEIIQDKMSFWQHIPWRLIGALHSSLGGSIARSKDILR